jgi:hypothetical protein
MSASREFEAGVQSEGSSVVGFGIGLLGPLFRMDSGPGKWRELAISLGIPACSEGSVGMGSFRGIVWMTRGGEHRRLCSFVWEEVS